MTEQTTGLDRECVICGHKWLSRLDASLDDCDYCSGRLPANLQNPPGPWSGTVARVNMPDPKNPGYRIVGYRVPEDEVGLIDGIFTLIEWDRAHVR